MMGTSARNQLSITSEFTYNPYTTTLKVPNIKGAITEANHANSSDTATKVSNKLTAGTKTYDGSAAVSLTKSDLGLGNVDNTSDATKQVYEANLKWGGKNFVGDFGPIDASMIPELGANRFAFLKPEGVEVEYSRDGGTTWVDYGWTLSDKQSFFSPTGNIIQIGKDNTTGTNKTNYQLRITITSNFAGIYSVLNKFAIYVSTNGSINCWCSIDVKTKANVDAGKDVWESRANKVLVSGWSGWNIINITPTITYGDNDTQYQKWRFTFGVGSHEKENEIKYTGLSVYRILAFGGVGWNTPSNLAKWGHAYTMDRLQSCTFPASVISTLDIYERGKALIEKYAPKSIETTVNNKVDKVSGKQLSTNDYTTDEKNKLASLENYTLPVASGSTLGGIKKGDRITITSAGVLSAEKQTDNNYTTTEKNKLALLENSGSLTANEIDAATDGESTGELTPEIIVISELKEQLERATADIDRLQSQQPAEDDGSALPLLCGQPPILFGAGTPKESVVPSNWRQFDPETGEGYNWTGLPSAIGQQYINTEASSGGRYIAVRDGISALKWLNC